MHYDFDRIIDRRNSDSAKWKMYDNDVLPLWVADMDFESPPPIERAMIERVKHNVFGYGRDPVSFKDILVERMSRLYNWQIVADDIVFLPGLVCGLNIVTRAIGETGDGVLINTPVYPPFISAPTNQGKVTQMAEQVKRVVNGHIAYEVDFDVIERTVQPNTSLFIVCNPHNPTGRAYSRSELEQMGEVALRHNLIICADEIHCDLLLSGTQHIPLASVSPEVAQCTITLMAPSKTFNVPGLGCSFAIIQNAELRQKFAKAAYGIVPHVNLLGMVAGEAAYADPECNEWLVQLHSYLTANRDFLVSFVDKHLPGIKTTVPDATYLAWLDCSEAGIEGNPYKFYLDQARVAFNDGNNFGQGGAGFVRVNFGCPRSILAEGLEKVRLALQTSK